MPVTSGSWTWIENGNDRPTEGVVENVRVGTPLPVGAALPSSGGVASPGVIAARPREDNGRSGRAREAPCAAGWYT